MKEIFDKVVRENNLTYANYIQFRTGDKLLEQDQNAKIPLKNKITIDKIQNKILHLYLKGIRMLIPKSIRDEIFINTSIGERHKWMYDRYSLRKLLENSGFRDIRILSYNTSEIPNFNEYMLDINSDNSPYKGISSIYMECKK